MSQTNGVGVLIGDSPGIRKARDLIARLGPTRLNVLIEGPTGTGKELVAEALHVASGRKGPFVACNVCAIPDSMFEDTMFGHERGAFSGATGSHAGYLSEANGGTLYLDELNGLASANQAKLLRAIELRSFRPVGSRADVSSDFRLISSTNVSLRLLTEGRSLRLDLAHRLATAVVTLPPLRDRVEDIPRLVAHFLGGMGVAHGVAITTGGQRALVAHDWPGNVRELKNVLERALALADRPCLDEWLIRDALGAIPPTSTEPDQADGGFTERRLLDVLRENEGNIPATAQQLGVHRTTLWRRLRRLRGAGGPISDGGDSPLDSTSIG